MMRFWANLIGYQLVWFSAVIGAGRGLAWPGVAAAGVFVAAQLAVDLFGQRHVLDIIRGFAGGGHIKAFTHRRGF